MGDERTTSAPSTDPWAWYYRLFVVWVASVYGLIGVAVIFGPERWRTAPSLNRLQDFLLPFWHIPWLVWGGLFVAAAVLVMLPGLWRVAGYVTSAVLCTLFVGFAVVFSLLAPAAAPPPAPRLPGAPYFGTTNVITIGLSLLAPLAMLAGIRFAVVNTRSTGTAAP